MSDGIMLSIGNDGVARAYDDTYDITIHCESREEQEEVRKTLESIPRWIPCSERLPGEADIYIVAVDKDYIPPRCDVVDTLWWEAKSKEWQYENRNAFVKYPAPVLAWMPLPEAFKGVTE